MIISSVKIWMSILEYEDVNALIVEYLKAQGMAKSANLIEQEIKSNKPNMKISMWIEKQKYIRRDWRCLAS